MYASFSSIQNLKVDGKLTHLFSLSVRQNQEIQGRIDHIQTRIRSREADVRDLALQLRAAETILQNALEETAPCVLAIKQAQQSQGQTSVHELINYASKMALTSGKIPGLNPLEPFPNSELFPRTRLMKELIPTREEVPTTMDVVETEPYVSFLGDVVTSDQQAEEEDLADF